MSLASDAQCVNAIPQTTPQNPRPQAKEIRIRSSICGIPITISMSICTMLSAAFPHTAAQSPIRNAAAALTAAVRSPIRMLKESPAIVRTNMSRPIQSVPNGYWIQGARFFRVKSVWIAVSFQKLPRTATSTRSPAARISSAKLFLLRFFIISASPPPGSSDRSHRTKCLPQDFPRRR